MLLAMLEQFQKKCGLPTLRGGKERQGAMTVIIISARGYMIIGQFERAGLVWFKDRCETTAAEPSFSKRPPA